MKTITSIGYIESEYKTPADPFEMRKKESTIIIGEKLCLSCYAKDYKQPGRRISAVHSKPLCVSRVNGKT